MINLLPKNAKRGVKREYWVRVGTTWTLLLAAALLLGTLMLVPTYVLITSQVAVYEASVDEVAAEVASYEDVSESFVRTNQQVAFLLSETGLPQLSGYVELFGQFESDRINISEIQISRTDVTLNHALLGGTAVDRQALAAFRDELLAHPAIVAVDLPISNLARGENIPFSMTVILNESTDNQPDV